MRKTKSGPEPRDNERGLTVKFPNCNHNRRCGGCFDRRRQARANTIDFFLATAEGSTTTTPTMGGSPATDPLVEVIVDELTTTTATVEFEIASGTFKAPVGINVNGPFDVTAISGSGNGNGQSLPCGYGQSSTCGAGGTSHAGSFNFETSAVNSGTITIDLTAENGTTWARRG